GAPGRATRLACSAARWGSGCLRAQTGLPRWCRLSPRSRTSPTRGGALPVPRKLAHLADLHLGYRQFDRQTPRGGNQREADVADAFRRAVDDLLAQRPNLIVIAGDVFNSVRPTNPAILFLFQQLQRVRVGLPDAP